MKRIAKLSLLLLSSLAFSVNAQVCNVNISETTPTSDFVNNGDGTVTHNATGLMWKRCSEGQTWNNSTGSCDGSSTGSTWQAALAIPATLNAGGGFAGKTDWRLPNIKELSSMIEYKCYARSLNEALFPNTATALGYWSSSPSAALSSRTLYDESWSVEFYYGLERTEQRSITNWVRLVRSAW